MSGLTSSSESRHVQGAVVRPRPVGVAIASVLCWTSAVFGGLLGLAIITVQLGSGSGELSLSPALRPLVAAAIYGFAGHALFKGRVIGGSVAVGASGYLALVESQIHTRLSLAMTLGNVAIVGLVVGNWRYFWQRRSGAASREG